MNMLREIWREILLMLGLRRKSKAQAKDNCSVRDCWGEMAARIREGGNS